MLNAKTDQTLKGFRLPPLTCSLSQTAVQLSADIYLPKGELETKYPDAVIGEAGCDRVMIWREEPRAETQSPAEGKSNHAFSSAPFAPLRETIWVVFMGTHNLPSLMSDLDVRRHSLGDGREVHAGFDNGVEELWPDILAGIQQAWTPGGSTARLSSPKSELAEVPGVQSPDGSASRPYLIWTGHSRGASQAILAADKFEDWLIQQPALPSVWTQYVLPIAPARPGNAAFRDRYNFRLGHKTFFYHHGADIVPWLPGWLLGNRQVGHRLWFPDVVAIPNRDRPPQSAALCREPLRVLDPSLPPLALNLIRLLARQYAGGLEALLADHHVSTYQALLSPRLKAKG